MVKTSDSRNIRICLECGAVVDWLDKTRLNAKEHPPDWGKYYYASVQKFLV